MPSASPTDAPPAQTTTRDLRADFALLSVALMWGINIPVMKYGVGKIDPFAFNAFRFVASVVVLALLDLSQSAKNPKPLRSAQTDWLRVSIVTIAGLLYQVIFVIGLSHTLSGNTAIILSTTPMWTALIAWMTGTDKLRGLAWAGLAITLGGTIAVTLDKGGLDWSTGYLLGNALMFGASLMWSILTVLSKPVLNTMTPIRLALIGAVCSLPVYFVLAAPNLADSFSALRDPKLLGCVVYSGVFSTGLAYAFWNFGIRQVGPSHSSIYQNLVPFIALTGGWFILKEIPGAGQIVGGVLILAGLVLMRRSR